MKIYKYVNIYDYVNTCIYIFAAQNDKALFNISNASFGPVESHEW